jgi:hypothetical protein
MKTCRVSFRDRQGIEHSVTVQAVHRYHAFGLALHQLRRCSWCHPDYREVERLHIQLLEAGKLRTPIVLTREEFERWLNTTESGLRTDKARQYLLMLFGRIPPDRDFKRGMEVR